MEGRQGECVQFWRNKGFADVFASQLASVRLEIAAGSRQLPARADDGVSLALNGRVGRRVACVLDKGDMGLEILDMAGEVMSEGGFSPGVP